MENNKKSKKGFIFTIIILVILVLVLSCYIIFGENYFSKKTDNNNSINNKENISSVSNDILNTLLSEKLNEYNIAFWDYNDLYNYYFTVDDDRNIKCNELYCNYYKNFNMETNNAISFPTYKFVKIENGKLHWNINNNWFQDKTINKSIKYFYINSFENEINDFIVYTEDNDLYVIKETTQTFNNYDDTGFVLTENIYNNYSYNKINTNGVIKDVQEKIYPVDCDSTIIQYYILDNDQIMILYNLDFIKLKDFLDKIEVNLISELNNTCNYAKYENVDIDFDGKLINIKDINNNDIYIKNYIQISKGDNKYSIIIDKNDFIYVSNNINDKNTLSPLTKIKNINYYEEQASEGQLYYEYHSKLKSIEFEDGRIIKFSDN